MVRVKWVIAWCHEAAKAKSGVLSKPSTTPVCRLESTSVTGMGTGEAPMDFHASRCTSLCCERIFLPLRSAGLLMGKAEPIER